MSPIRPWPRAGVRTRLPVVFRSTRDDFQPTDIDGLALWLDASASGDLFQNSDGTVPAVNAGDPVGYWRDRSGNGRHATQATGASRPTISATAQNGRKALAFDGANGWMRTDRTTYAARSVFTVFRRTGTAAANTYIGPFSKQASVAAGYGGASYNSSQAGGWSAASGAANNRLYWNNNALTAAYHNGASIPSVAASDYTVGFPAPIDTVTPAILYAEVAGETSGNQSWFFGTEAFSTARKYPADMAEVLIYSRALTTSERQRIERYLAARWGITLAPQVSNADAQDWVNRVYANGGTVSASTAAAVNQFCVDIEAASLRDRFYRLNLFCGTGLNACLVPLYRGTSLGGTQYGNTTDTNVGAGPFVTNDYSETGASGGLKGNGSSKYLDTGLEQSIIPLTNFHLSASLTAGETSYTAENTLIGHYNVAQSDFAVLRQAVTTGTRDFLAGSFGASVASAAPSSVEAHVLGVRSSATSTTLYRSGSSVASSSVNVGSATTSSRPYFVFARNNTGSPNNYTSARLRMYSIGAAIDGTGALAFANAVAAFNTAMGRA